MPKGLCNNSKAVTNNSRNLIYTYKYQDKGAPKLYKDVNVA